MDIEFLSWLGTFINFLILAYLSINIIKTECFNLLQMGLSFLGLIASIFINIVTITLKQNNKNN